MCVFLYPIIQPCVVSVSQRLTCPQWQEPYCLMYESYARTPLVMCLQMAIINSHSRLVCLLAHSLSTRADQIAACGLLVIRNQSLFQDLVFCPFIWLVRCFQWVKKHEFGLVWALNLLDLSVYSFVEYLLWNVYFVCLIGYFVCNACLWFMLK